MRLISEPEDFGKVLPLVSIKLDEYERQINENDDLTSVRETFQYLHNTVNSLDLNSSVTSVVKNNEDAQIRYHSFLKTYWKFIESLNELQGRVDLFLQDLKSYKLTIGVLLYNRDNYFKVVEMPDFSINISDKFIENFQKLVSLGDIILKTIDQMRRENQHELYALQSLERHIDFVVQHQNNNLFMRHKEIQAQKYTSELMNNPKLIAALRYFGLSTECSIADIQQKHQDIEDLYGFTKMNDISKQHEELLEVFIHYQALSQFLVNVSVLK